MRQTIPSFDPSAVTSGQISNPLPQNQIVNGGYGFWLWANESSVSLIVTVNQDRFRVHPWEIAKITFDEPCPIIYWAQEVMLTNSSSAPISLCLIDAYTSDEVVTDAFPIPLVRTTNVGGVVNTATVETLINNGNLPNTLIIQTQPSDQSTPAFQLDNEGNLVLRTVSSNVWSIIMQVIDGGASPATALFHGAADSLAAGLQANTLEIGTSATEKISFHDLDGGPEVGIISATKAIWLASAINTGLLYNAAFDNTNYRFLATGDFAAQLLLSKDAGVGVPTVPRFNIRYSTTTGTAGNIITWNQWQILPTMLNNNGTGGAHIFTGTTTPSGAVTGDLWFNA